MGKNELVAFDYNAVDKETKGKLLALAGQVKRGREHYNKSVIELGESIHEAHDLLANHKNGTFGKWVIGECGLEETTARNYMNAFKAFGKYPATVAGYSAGAMYLLSSPEAPVGAFKEAKKRVDNGEKMTTPLAKEILSRFKTPKPSSASRSADTAAAKPPKPSAETVSQESAHTGSAALSDDPIGDACEHERDEEGDACRKCRCPMEPVNEDSEPVEVTLEHRMAEWNKAVESLARAVSSALDDAITGPWLGESDDDNRLGIAKTQLKSAAATIRLAKCPHVCCKCDGKGCKACRESGMMPKNTYEMMGGK